MPSFIIYEDEQEKQEIVIRPDIGNEIYISSQNHDMHGWDGMQEVRDTIECLGNALKIPVKYKYKEFD